MPAPQLRLTLACMLVVRSKVHSHTLDLLWQYADAVEARVKEISWTAPRSVARIVRLSETEVL